MSKQLKPPAIFLITLSLLFFLGIAGVFLFFWWWNTNMAAVDSQTTAPQTIIVPPATGANAIADILEENGIIRSGLVFRLYIKKTGLDKALKPGKYEFSKSQDLATIVQMLSTGVSEDFWITIPEGKRREEIALLIATAYQKQGLLFDIAIFLQATEDIEGYLFPDTYLVPKDMDEQGVASLMRTTFDKKIPDTTKAQANRHNLTFQQILTLASLVEREAKFTKDRPMVAQVLLNRIALEMPLQIDATVQYAIGTAQCRMQIGKECNWWPVISDTTFDSIYNTYQHSGLPPAPIANPGLAAIEAVLDPAPHDYLYYLSEPNGTTHYTKTLEEHNVNIDRYLK